MSKDLAIKVYDVDYSFIIKNYLDKELWHKVWTVFQWRNITVKINLYRIDIYDDSVFINVKAVDSDTGYMSSQLIYYFVEKCDIKFLKKKVNSAIMDCLLCIERQMIKDGKDYEKIRKIESKEKRRIKDIVKNYFLKKDIKYSLIIESTYDSCLDEFSKHNTMESNYCDSLKCKVLNDLFEEFSRITEKKLDISESNPKEILEKCSEYYEYLDTEDFEKSVIDFIEDEIEMDDEDK